jgi:uncharacterized protein (DUF362 family)/NAD-dependent dihydropyrimidine dehydrogenase PreA subunit
MITTQKYDVYLGKCPEYDDAILDTILAEAADNSGFPDIKGLRVLVKPNLLNASPSTKAVTTNPIFLSAVLRLLEARGAGKILIGDSPAWQNGASTGKVAGLWRIAADHNCSWVDFKASAPRNSPDAKLVPNFLLTTVLDECDIVINLPKLKTHQFMYYTGAVKNFFGLMPGMAKSGMHLRYPDSERFGTMLVDLSRTIPRSFTFMDGIIAMEGPGPGSGKPFPLGLVLASSDPAALDWVALQCIGYEPTEISYILDAIARTGRNPQKPEIVLGPERIENVAAKNFERIPLRASALSTISKAPSLLRNFIGSVSISRPKFNADLCVGCLACVNVCPNGALAFEKTPRGKNQIRIDDSACIQCYCCHEVCPEKAITIGRVILRKPGAKRTKPRSQAAETRK